jgi:Family of unknown function (DUF5895)
VNNNLDFDFGFDSEEFTGSASSIPYAQFLNSSASVFGLAITKANVELADFKPSSAYKVVDHQFDDGTPETLCTTTDPRMVIINRSEPLMSNKENKTIPYDKATYQEGDWKAFSYAVIWLLDENNEPLSEMPFRLKCSGFAGITFLKNYSYYSNPDSFTKKFLAIYKQLTGDRTINKNDVFYAHAVYQIELVREKATSSFNGQSSMAVQTKSFVEPTKENFGSLIIRNGSPLSEKIKTAIKETKEWLKFATVQDENQALGEEGDQENITSANPVMSTPVASVNATVKDNSEYAELVQNAALNDLGWSRGGLNIFLLTKYGCNVDQMRDLPEHTLIQIYDAIQDPAVISMFNPDKFTPEEAIIPF